MLGHKYTPKKFTACWNTEKKTNIFALFFFLFWKCLEVAPNNCGFPCADVCSGTAMVGEWKHRKHRASRRKHRLLSAASIETEKTERPWPLLVTASVSGLLYSSMGIFNNISLRAIREGAYYMLFWNFLCLEVTILFMDTGWMLSCPSVEQNPMMRVFRPSDNLFSCSKCHIHSQKR